MNLFMKHKMKHSKMIKKNISYKFVFSVFCMYFMPIFSGNYYPLFMILELAFLVLFFLHYLKNFKFVLSQLENRCQDDITRFAKGYFGSIINKKDAIITFEITPQTSLIDVISNRKKIKSISYNLAKAFFKSKERLYLVSRLIQMTLFILFLSFGICCALD